jgi:hypothetical protein
MNPGNLLITSPSEEMPKVGAQGAHRQYYDRLKTRHTNGDDTIIITPQPKEALHTIPERRYGELTIIDPIIGIGPQELTENTLKEAIETPGIVILNPGTTPHRISTTHSQQENPDTKYEKYVTDRTEHVQSYLDTRDDSEHTPVSPRLWERVLTLLYLRYDPIPKTVCVAYPRMNTSSSSLDTQTQHIRTLEELVRSDSTELILLEPDLSALPINIQSQYNEHCNILTMTNHSTGTYSPRNADSYEFESAVEHESITSTETVENFILEYNAYRTLSARGSSD